MITRDHKKNTTGAKATTYTTCVNMDGKGAMRHDVDVLAAHWFQRNVKCHELIGHGKNANYNYITPRPNPRTKVLTPTLVCFAFPS